MTATDTALTIHDLQKEIEQKLQAIQLDRPPKELYDPIRYILAIGGKRLRPVLVLKACELFDVEYSAAMSQAMAVEVFHNFTLVHDDIMDNAPLRRKQATIHEKWNPNTAILSGDVMLVLAYELLIQAVPEKLPGLLRTFNEVAKRVCEGQQDDMNFESREAVTIAEYMTMISNKTAALLGGSLQIGGIMANAGPENEEKLYQIGESLGMAFQLQDDWLDVFGDPEKFGKRVGGDIVSNKKTWLMLKARELADDAQLATLNELHGRQNISEEELVSGVIAIYEELGVKDLAMAHMQEHYQKAEELLQGLKANESRKAELWALAQSLMARES